MWHRTLAVALTLTSVLALDARAQVLQIGLDGVGWENANDTAPLLYREVPENDFVSVRAKISGQTVGFWSQAGVIARVPAPANNNLPDENYSAVWSYQPSADNLQLQHNTNTAGVEAEQNEGGLSFADLQYVRLDNLGAGEFLAYRGSGSDDNITWTPFNEDMMATQTNVNIDNQTLQVGIAGGAIGALAGSSATYDWVEIETTSETFRDDFDYTRNIATEGVLPGGIWTGTENVSAGGFDMSAGDLGRCLQCLWDDDDPGDFNVATNWASGDGPAPLVSPAGSDTTVVFGDAIDSPTTIFNDQDVTVAGVQFDNASTYAVGGTGSLTLEAESGSALIDVVQGSHQIQQALSLNSDTDAMAAAGARLDINANVSLNGNTLSVTGDVFLNNGVDLGGGMLALAAPLTVGGAANLDGGTLLVDAESVIAPSMTLLSADSLSADGLELGGSAATGYALSVQGSSVVISSIPEPAAALLGLAGLAGLAAVRRRRASVMLVALLAVALCGASVDAQTGTFRDDFDVRHDYSGATDGGAVGTVPAGGIWSGIHNPTNGGDDLTPAFFIANGEDFNGNDKSGLLFIEDLNLHPNTDGSFGIGWEGARTNAPFLYRDVPAELDFTATMKIDAETAGVWSHTGIMARIKGPEPGLGLGDDIVDENFVNVGPFRTDDANPDAANLLMQNIVDAGEAESNQNLFPDGAPVPVYVRLEKSGSVFQGSMSLDGENFMTNEDLQFNNPAFVEGETMEIGLGHWRYGGSPGEVDIDFFELEVFESTIQTIASWNVDRSGDWEELNNWMGDAPGYPNSNVVSAMLGDVITAPRTVYTDGAVMAKEVMFDSAHQYAVSGTGGLTLEADSGPSRLDAMQGSHEVQVALTLATDTESTIGDGAQVDLNNSVDLGGNDWTVGGDGLLNFNNNLEAGSSGAVIVSGGTVGGSGRVNGALRNGDASNPGGVVSPGQSVGTLTVAGGFSQNETGTLEIELGGTGEGEHDLLAATGAVGLNGLLNIEYANDYFPTAGDIGTTWDIVTSDSSVIDLGLALDPSDASFYSLTFGSGVLQLTLDEVPVIGGDLVGDYNDDGVVDAGDYVLWRDTLGTSTTLANRDPGSSGPVSAADYAAWQENYGATSAALSDVGAPVPEPASLAGLAVAAAMATLRRRRR